MFFFDFLKQNIDKNEITKIKNKLHELFPTPNVKIFTLPNIDLFSFIYIYTEQKTKNKAQEKKIIEISS